MKTPEEVSAVLMLHQLGWGSRRIAQALGMSRNTVRRYVAQGAWQAYRRPPRQSLLDGLEEWLAEAFHLHRGNAEAVRQELARVHGVAVSLRTVERAVARLRQGRSA